MTTARIAAGLLLLVLLPACSGQEGPAASAPTAVPPAASTAPPACPQDPVEAAMCRFVTAVQAGEVTELSPAEQEVAATTDSEVPAGGWTPSCELIGDVTVLCELSFADASEQLGFHVAPVNVEYDDGQLITPDGEPVRYEVVEYLGTGAAGSFG